METSTERKKQLYELWAKARRHLLPDGKVIAVVHVISDVAEGYLLAAASGYAHRRPDDPADLQPVFVEPAKLKHYERGYLGCHPLSLLEPRDYKVYQWPSPTLFVYPENFITERQHVLFAAAVEGSPLLSQVLVLTKDRRLADLLGVTSQL